MTKPVRIAVLLLVMATVPLVVAVVTSGTARLAALAILIPLIAAIATPLVFVRNLGHRRSRQMRLPSAVSNR